MLAEIEEIRKSTSSNLDQKIRSALGQYFTPQSIAEFMASMFNIGEERAISLLDAGAGVGSLSAAFLERLLGENIQRVHLTAFEIDQELSGILTDTLIAYKEYLEENNKQLDFKVIAKDFIEYAVLALFSNDYKPFDFAILNPPYHKINSNSRHRHLLRKAGIETVNLYAAFVGLAIKMLAKKGQLVVIIPRSFCNGPYYKPFRKLLLLSVAIQHIHLFEARNKAFGEDGVLQENVILHLIKGKPQIEVKISTSSDGRFSDYSDWNVPFTDIVKDDDDEFFIHIPHQVGKSALNNSKNICHTLSDIDCAVSTGPIVDFRVKDHLRKRPENQTAPLIYPAHFNGWGLHHPIDDFKKYNAIEINSDTKRQLFPSGFYTVVRRFSSKEEKRRIVAKVVRPSDLFGDNFGFENHLNVFHFEKSGIPEELAYGLAVYLNSSSVDEYFRLFSGHTQVNATDLRNLYYPSKETLTALGRWAKTQKDFDLTEIDKKVFGIL
jgi:adenine-specific DNA-methyltransferase